MAKTKELMIDVARQLFARFGVHNTTMNDIADAAHKGRRTLYTYFKNKDEIFYAVIERELEQLYSGLVAAKNLSLRPNKKLMNFIYTHLETMKELVMRNGSLRADFFRDIWTVEKVRKSFDRKEVILIKDILDEGVTKKTFSIKDTQSMAFILLNAFKGLEVPYISGHIRNSGSEYEQIRKSVEELIFRGILADNVDLAD